MPQSQNTLPSIRVSPIDVYNAIKSLKNSSTTDIYGLNSKILKACSYNFIVFLCDFFNACLQTGYFPQVFKMAKVLPIPKNRDHDSINNFRPISIIPILGKLLERIVNRYLYEYFEDNNLLSPTQFGFRKNKSTIAALRSVVGHIVEGFEAGDLIGLTMFDLSKAFDCVSHDILLRKLEWYGICGNNHKFLKSYLQSRYQVVEIKGSLSSQLEVKHGVPQGSILGPLLFLIYINDLEVSLSPGVVIEFADDCTLITRGNSIDRVNEDTQFFSDKMLDWFKRNRLTSNESKTTSMLISTNRKLKSTDPAKLLGIIIDPGLSWLPYINNISSKMAKSIFVLRRLKYYLPDKELLNAFHAYVQAHISYAVELWGADAHADIIFKLQKRALRILAGVNYRESCRDIFPKFNIPTVSCLYILRHLVHIHSNLADFNTNGQYHSYATRAAHDLRPLGLRLSTSCRNSSQIDLYNKVPPLIRKLNSKQFKLKVKTYLIENAFYSVSEYLQRDWTI